LIFTTETAYPSAFLGTVLWTPHMDLDSQVQIDWLESCVFFLFHFRAVALAFIQGKQVGDGAHQHPPSCLLLELLLQLHLQVMLACSLMLSCLPRNHVYMEGYNMCRDATGVEELGRRR
jgi:hypothetical protein